MDFEERSLLSLLFFCLFVCSLSNIRLDAKNDGKDLSKTAERESKQNRNEGEIHLKL